MLKFLKMTVAEDVIIMVEILAVVLAEEVQLQEEKVVLLQEEKVLADSEATEAQLQEKVVSETTEVPDQDAKVPLTEHLDVLKVLATHLDQEDQEETNTYC